MMGGSQKHCFKIRLVMDDNKALFAHLVLWASSEVSQKRQSSWFKYLYNVFICSFWSTLFYFVRRYVLTEINLRRNKQKELISFAEILAFWLCQVPTIPC